MSLCFIASRTFRTRLCWGIFERLQRRANVIKWDSCIGDRDGPFTLSASRPDIRSWICPRCYPSPGHPDAHRCCRLSLGFPLHRGYRSVHFGQRAMSRREDARPLRGGAGVPAGHRQRLLNGTMSKNQRALAQPSWIHREGLLGEKV